MGLAVVMAMLGSGVSKSPTVGDMAHPAVCFADHCPGLSVCLSDRFSHIDRGARDSARMLQTSGSCFIFIFFG